MNKDLFGVADSFDQVCIYSWQQNIEVVERMIGMIMANLGHQHPPPLILFNLMAVNASFMAIFSGILAALNAISKHSK